MNISFLLGAGFSKPAGFPLASEINERFSNLQPGDISVHSDGSAWFNNGNPGPNDWMNKVKAENLKKVIDLYKEKEIPDQQFHYEEFYDWIKDIQSERKNCEAINHIAAVLHDSTHDFMVNIDILFNQLIKNLLSMNLPSSFIPPSHSSFINLINKLSKYTKIDIHTLNHDILLESFHFEKEISDGFLETGSPFYGDLYTPENINNVEIPIMRTVRLAYYQNKYKKPINIYKLHGSINHYNIREVPDVTVKTMKGVGRNFIKKEVRRSELFEYDYLGGLYNATFLSGTTFKITQYESTRYLSSVFEHFQENLQNSKVLVVIGYGFKDDKINEIIRDKFLGNDDEKIFVIGNNRPETNFEYDFFSGGVERFNHTELFDKIIEIYPKIELQR